MLSIPLLLFAGACSAAPVGSATPAAPNTPPALPGNPTAAQTSPTSPLPVEQPTLVPLPAVSAEDWSHGPLGAAATIVVYSDFQ